MPTVFHWTGLTSQKQKAQGSIEAKSAAFARAKLRRNGIAPLQIRKTSHFLAFSKNKKIKSQDILIFTRQLAILIQAGVPLLQAINMLAKGNQQNSMREMLQSIGKTIASGQPLSAALRLHPKQFSRLFCQQLNASEQSGTLDATLETLAQQQEKMAVLARKIKKACYYPATVVVVALLLILLLLIWVVPQFESLFQGFGATLPLSTQFVITLSHTLQQYALPLAGTFSSVIYAFCKSVKRSTAFRRKLDTMLLRAPLLGMLLRKAAIARYARTLATGFASGLPLIDALNAAAETCGQRVYQQGIITIRDAVLRGQAIHTAMQATDLFPHTVVQMVAVGEASGDLDTLLHKVAERFEAEVDDALSNLSSLLEPFIMIVLGVLLGGLMIALYLPIFKLGSVM